MTTAVLTPNEEWAIRRAFKEHVDRCELVMHRIFGRFGEEVVSLRSWLYEVATTPWVMADTIHTEPLYLVAEFIGIDTLESEFSNKVEDYKRLIRDEKWNEVST